MRTDRTASDAEKKAKSRDKLIREAAAWAGYRHPQHETFRADLTTLLDNPTAASWIQTGNIIQHMTNYHRRKLLKHYPELFPDFTLFNLMLNAFVAESEIAEFALAYVSRLTNTQQFQQLLSSIPEKEINSFLDRSLEIISFPLEEDKIDLVFYPEIKEFFMDEDSEASEAEEKQESALTLNSFAALASGLAGAYYLTGNVLLTSLPALYGLYLLYESWQPANSAINLLDFSMWSPPRTNHEYAVPYYPPRLT